jgi:hypothetical protein
MVQKFESLNSHKIFKSKTDSSLFLRYTLYIKMMQKPKNRASNKKGRITHVTKWYVSDWQVWLRDSARAKEASDSISLVAVRSLRNYKGQTIRTHGVVVIIIGRLSNHSRPPRLRPADDCGTVPNGDSAVPSIFGLFFVFLSQTTKALRSSRDVRHDTMRTDRT